MSISTMHIWLEQRRYTSVLIALVILLCMIPFLQSSLSGLMILRALFSVLVLALVLSVRRGKLISNGIIVLALAWMIISWIGPHISPFGSNQVLPAATNILALAIVILATAFIVSDVLFAKRIDFDILSGGVAVYLLIGIAWALVHTLVERTVPGSFHNLATSSEPLTVDAIYFSLTTLTTLGYGDIAPISTMARMLAVLEAVTGVIYLAILIPSLVSLYLRYRQ